MINKKVVNWIASALLITGGILISARFKYINKQKKEKYNVKPRAKNKD